MGVRKKSRPGFERKNARQDSVWSNSWKALGLEAVAWEDYTASYYRARYYDSSAGRFLAEDPSAFDGGDVNFYAYVSNSPMVFMDPLGTNGIVDRIINHLRPLPPPPGIAGHPPKPPSTMAPRFCSGTARVLQGNPDTVGRRSGFDTQPANKAPKITVPFNSAAVIPRQWGGASALRPFLRSVRGSAGIGSSSQNIVGIGDTVGSTDVADVQNVLMNANPGMLILELVNGVDLGTVPVTLMVPAGISCPCGTTETGRLW